MFVFQATLSLLCARANRVRVINGGSRGGKALGNEVLYEGSGSELDGLSKALRATGFIPARCMCHGTYAIEFWKGDTLLNTIGYHHHSSLRHPYFPFDAILWNRRGLADWLSARGVYSLWNDLEEERGRNIEEKEARKRWRAAAPDCLRPLLSLLEFGVAPAFHLIELNYIEPRAACSALLEWYGQGRGMWSGYFQYEDLPRELLYRYPAEAVESAIIDGLDNPNLVLGAARLLGTNSSYLERSPSLQDLPQVVWVRFQEEVERQGYQDNLERLAMVKETILGPQHCRRET